MKKSSVLICASVLLCSCILCLSACTKDEAELPGLGYQEQQEQQGQQGQQSGGISQEQLEAMQLEYADLLINGGLRLHQGQTLLIRSQVESYEFTRLCVQAAYAAGAKQVIVQWEDDDSTLEGLLKGDAETIADAPAYLGDFYQYFLDKDSAYLRLMSSDPNAFSKADGKLLGSMNAALAKLRKGISTACNNGSMAWTVAAVPQADWAELVFPELNGDDAMNALWELILSCCYVSGDGKALEAWNEHVDQLVSQSQKLNAANIRTLHYTNSLGTDLTITIPKSAVWCSAFMEGADGNVFCANVPTEEFFTAPEDETANGVIYASMPFVVNGTLVKDAVFTLENGKIVKAEASSGHDALLAALDTDEGSRYLGEISLVSLESPIAQAGVLTYNGLIDENASCHMAFGYAYSECIQGGITMDDSSLRDCGLNVDSSVHFDFMVGTDDLKVVATTLDGEEITIMEKGDFCAELFNPVN